MNTKYLDKNLLSFLRNVLDVDLDKDLIFIKNHNFEYTYVNSVFCNLFNLSIEEIIGKKDKDFFKDEDAIEICHLSDIKAYETNYLIHEEKAFNKEFRVLKIRINLGDKKDGLLCFAKINKSNDELV